MGLSQRLTNTAEAIFPKFCWLLSITGEGVGNGVCKLRSCGQKGVEARKLEDVGISRPPHL